MAGGVDHLALVDGTYGYYRENGDITLTLIVDADFPDPPSSLCYIDGFFIVTKGGLDEYYISSAEDASAWDGLDWASAEDSPDDIILGHAYNRHLVAFGERTIEIHYNTGDASFPFTRVAGAVMQIGLGAAASVASGPEGIFFLDHQYQVRQGQGYESIVISPQQVEYHIRQYEDKSDAIGYTYTQEGHSFYVLTFPTGRKTWAYDITTGMWHTRASGMDGGRHRANWHQFFADKNLVGDYRNGKIYELDLGTFDDDASPIRSIRRAQVVQANRKMMFHSALEVELEPGVGLNSGQGSDPKAMLRWSDDYGDSWSNEHWAGMGRLGKRKQRVIWRRLGRSRARIYELVITDPVKRILTGAQLEAEVSDG